MTRSAETATVLGIVRVEAGSHKSAARAGEVVSVSGWAALADHADAIACKDLGAEGYFVLPVISPLTGCAAATVGGTLVGWAP